MDKLPSLPSKSASDALVNAGGENAVKPPANGAKSEFPRLLAETPAVRKASGSGVGEAEGEALPGLPPETAGGKELPPGQLPDAQVEPPTDAALQALDVALPPGLLWAPVAEASGAQPVQPLASDVIVVPATQPPAVTLVTAPTVSAPVDMAANDEPPESPATSSGHVVAGALPLPSAGQSGAAEPMSKPPAAQATATALAELIPKRPGAADGSAANGLAVEAPPMSGLTPDAPSGKATGLAIDSGMGMRLAQPTAEAPPVARVAPSADTIDAPVGRLGWDHQLSSRILWVVREQLQHAELRLNPPHLGPLEVRLSLQPDQSVNLGFSASQLQVRDAIEAALPRLREMLVDGGLNLGDVNVSSQSGSGSGSERESRQTNAQDYRSAADTPDEIAASAVVSSRGLVDFFA